MKFHRLSDADIEAVSVVRKGANRKTVFLKKEHADEADLIDFGTRDLIVKSDWSRFYCVVAEPDAPEDPGVLAKDQSIPDVWGEDEIRKAQASFVKNGGLINKMHESLDPYGTLVENAIALADFTIDGETIKKGSWYIAVEPTEEGKTAIDNGDFTGVSIQGTATRTLVDKAEQFTKPGTANVSASDRKKLGPLLAHYAAKAHPFTSCKRDQMKHGLSEDHANRRCAVLKQLIRGGSAVAKWHVAKGAGEGDAPWSEDVALALDRVEVQAQMLKADLGDFAPLFREDVAKAKFGGRAKFQEQKHPRKGGKFAPKGSATVRSRPGGTPAGGKDPARANRLKTASNILGSLGYKGQKLGDAIRDFQKKNGLPETGEADPQTLVAMRSKMAGRRTKQRAAAGKRPKKRSPKKQRAKRARVKAKGKPSSGAAGRIQARVNKRGFLERLHPRKNDGKFRDKGGPATAIEALSGGVLKPKTTDQQQMTADLINLKDGETKDFGHGVKATKKGKHIHITGAGDKGPIKMPAFERKDHLYAKDAVLRRLEAAKKAKVKKAKGKQRRPGASGRIRARVGKRFDPRQARGAHTGQWIKVGDLSTGTKIEGQVGTGEWATKIDGEVVGHSSGGQGVDATTKVKRKDGTVISVKPDQKVKVKGAERPVGGGGKQGVDPSKLPPLGKRPKLKPGQYRSANENTLRAILTRQYRFADDSVQDRQRAQAELQRRKGVQKAKLTAAERDKLPDSDFAGPNRTCPIHDLPHAKAALSMCADVPGVKAKVYRRYPQLKPDDVKKAESPVWAGVAG